MTEGRTRICAAVGGALLLGGAAGLVLAVCERAIIVWREPASETVRNPALAYVSDADIDSTEHFTLADLERDSAAVAEIDATVKAGTLPTLAQLRQKRDTGARLDAALRVKQALAPAWKLGDTIPRTAEWEYTIIYDARKPVLYLSPVVACLGVGLLLWAFTGPKGAMCDGRGS